MRLQFAARTDIGCKREANEDFLATLPERGLFVVADGLGGHVAGRHASETGVASFLEHARAEPSTERLRSALRTANEVIRAEAERDVTLRGMGTTLAALWLTGNAATLVNVGDSRIYLLRDGAFWQLTLDYSLVSDLIARGELDPRDARSHPHRHVITRALGVAPTVEPDISGLRIRAGDCFVLCTDGISSQLSDEEIHRIARQHWGDLDKAAQELIEAANAQGGDDNATVVLVSL